MSRQQHRQVEHPFGALAYAIKHSYDSLANQIAEMQLSKTSSKARMSLNPRALSAWEAYVFLSVPFAFLFSHIMYLQLRVTAQGHFSILRRL